MVQQPQQQVQQPQPMVQQPQQQVQQPQPMVQQPQPKAPQPQPMVQQPRQQVQQSQQMVQQPQPVPQPRQTVHTPQQTGNKPITNTPPTQGAGRLNTPPIGAQSFQVPKWPPHQPQQMRQATYGQPNIPGAFRFPTPGTPGWNRLPPIRQQPQPPKQDPNYGYPSPMIQQNQAEQNVHWQTPDTGQQAQRPRNPSGDPTPMVPPRQPLRYKTLGDRVDKLKGEHIIQQGYNKPSFTTYRQPPVAHMDSDTPHPTSSTSGAESITNIPTYRQNHPQMVKQQEKVDEKIIQQRLEVGTPQQDQITNKEKLVKAQNASINQQAVLIDLLERIQPKDDQQRNNREIEELITLAKEGILSQQVNLEQSQAEITQSKQVATHYSPSLSKPDVYEFTDMTIPGTKEALQPKNIKAAIDTFNPDKHPESDFADTWRQILLYVKDYKIDSAAYMTILSIIIQGSASRLIFHIRNDKNIRRLIRKKENNYGRC